MGQKTHPKGFRLGSFKDWDSKWHEDRNYAIFLKEDLEIRRAIKASCNEGGISRMEIEKGGGEVSVTIHTSRPGVVIGRRGQRVDEMKNMLEGLTGKKVELNIREIQFPELDANLVAQNIASQLEKGVSYRRARKRPISQALSAGAKGIKVKVKGRLGGQELARQVTEHQGSVPLHTLRSDIDYGFSEANTGSGKVGVKVWIYKGDMLATPPKEQWGILETDIEE